MARHRHKGGRVTPPGTRPPHLRVVGDQDDTRSPIDGMVDDAGRDLLAVTDPLAAEMWASTALAAFDSAAQQARLEGMDVPPFAEALLGACRRRRDRAGAVVAAALAAVVPPPHDRLAAAVAAELRAAVPRLPAWVGREGKAGPTRAWVASDVFGDQDSLIIGFAHPGQAEEHSLVVLVDHNLSGQAKDAWVGQAPEEVAKSWQSASEPHMRVREVPVNEALAQLRDAMAVSDFWNGDTELRSEDFAQLRALVWARLSRAGLDNEGAQGPVVSDEEKEALVKDFLASPMGQALALDVPGADHEILAHHVVSLRADYEGQPLRWSPGVVAYVLGELAPRKLLLKPEEAVALPAVVRAFVRYSAGRTGLEAPFVDEILEAVDAVEHVFLERMDDPDAAGPAKAVLATLMAKGVDLSDPDAINRALQEGIKLPRPKRSKKPSLGPAPADVAASVETAPVLARFELLAGFYGPGRKLTQTGQPTLADARELVKLLGTRDEMDQKIGDKVFKTVSAAKLPELAFMLRWAQASGVLRKQHGKLRATASWAKLSGKPVERWSKAADAVWSLGPLASYYAHARYRDHNELLDELAPAMLFVIDGDPVPFEGVLDWVCEQAELGYDWLDPYMQDPEHRRSRFGHDLETMARVLDWAGIVTWAGATVEADQWGFEQMRGGTLQLTRAGRWWAVGE